jgi:hypothetical protein
MTDELTIIAIQILARDDIADLRATRDADELADYLIHDDPHDAMIGYAPLDDAIMNDDDDAAIAIMNSLHPILVAMIIDPIE